MKVTTICVAFVLLYAVYTTTLFAWMTANGTPPTDAQVQSAQDWGGLELIICGVLALAGKVKDYLEQRNAKSSDIEG